MNLAYADLEKNINDVVVLYRKIIIDIKKITIIPNDKSNIFFDVKVFKK